MSHRFTALSVVLGAILSIASLAALWVGISDWIVASAGPRQHLLAQALSANAHGWFQLDGCVRHDLAVVVTEEGLVYRLGDPAASTDDADRIYTPLAARQDCDDDHPPSHVYALVEDAEATGTTLGRAAPSRIAPPSIPAVVDGTIGPRIGDHGRANKARKKIGTEIAGINDAPLLRKGGRPGVRWVAAVTAGSGIHGFLLLALGARWLRRRAEREEALRTGQVDEAEESFFRSETID